MCGSCHVLLRHSHGTELRTGRSLTGEARRHDARLQSLGRRGGGRIVEKGAHRVGNVGGDDVLGVDVVTGVGVGWRQGVGDGLMGLARSRLAAVAAAGARQDDDDRNRFAG